MRNALPATMQAIEISAPGGPEVLKPAVRPLPVPKAHEVLVRVTAAGINGPDIMQRKGLYPAPAGASDLLGLEVSGEVVAKGAAVTRWSVGDTVVALTNGGGYAEYVAVDAGHCLTVPPGISLLDAAGLPETYFTVWSNVFIGAGLKAGKPSWSTAVPAASARPAYNSAKPLAPKSLPPTVRKPAARCARTSALTGWWITGPRISSKPCAPRAAPT